MRRFIVFLQPEHAPKYDFFSLHEAGYVAKWCTDLSGFDEVYCDLLICDYDNAPDASRQACRKVRTSGQGVAIYVSSNGLEGEEVQPDVVLQPGLSESDFIVKLDQLWAGGTSLMP